MAKAKKMTFGLLVGNRGFFPDALVRDGYGIMAGLLKTLGYGVVVLGEKETKFGSVETWQDAKKCAGLFKKNRERIDGVIITLPNFGDERAAADALRLAGLNVPVLVHAWADDPDKMTITHRRDSFCGKISVCNNLLQYRIPFTLTREHTMAPETAAFAEELRFFEQVCRVAKGVASCRVGAIGARPAAFNTVRFSEKLLAEAGIVVETVDLSEILGRAEKLKDGSAVVKDRIKAIQNYAPAGNVPQAALAKMAKLGLVIDEWCAQAELDVTAIQCWTALEDLYGVVPCTVMSMLSESLRSSACEVDVCGAISMHALALASGSPSFLLDWNNNYGADPDRCVCFHCSNLPKSCFKEAHIDYQAIIAGSVGKQNTYGTMVGRVKAEPMTFARITTVDPEGCIEAYVGEGRFTDDPLKTFGGYGVLEIPDLQELLQHICSAGFEHHVAANLSLSARAVHEAFDNYLGWETYWHGE